MTTVCDEQLISTYSFFKSTYKTAHNLGIDRNEVYRRLKKLNVPMVGKSGPKQENKIKFDENYFQEIDNAEKAYWLGFIAADGCVRLKKNGGHEFSLHLSAKDKEHLILFKQAIQSEHTIVHNEKTNSVNLRIVRKTLTDSLVRLGIVPLKTLTDFYIPDVFTSYWLRGLFDGDGSFWVRSRSGLIPQVAFTFTCATQSQINQIKMLLHKSNIVGGTIYPVTSNSYHFSTEGNKQVAKISKLIYQDDFYAPILQRKFDIVKHLL